MEKACIQRAVTLSVCSKAAQAGAFYIPAAVSARHIHLCEKDIYALFGAGYTLTKYKDLTQPGQYACNEKVTIKGSRGQIADVRILGPARNETQVEISATDSYKLGIKAMVRMSGDIAGTPGATLIGPLGSIELSAGVIISARHLHISDEQASIYGLLDKDIISLKKSGDREIIFGNVLVRSGSKHSLEAHFDTDEANAAMLKNGELLEIAR